MKNKNVFDVVVIGAGPAGLTAGIYLGRAKIKAAIIEKNAPGGKIIMTSSIENYPGVVNTTGVDLALSMLEQVNNQNIPMFYDEVLSVKKENGLFVIETNNDIFETKYVLNATGTINRTLEVPGEQKLFNRGISFCAICDGNLYQGQDVLVVGGGNSAFEESLYLSKICRHVYLIHRTNQFRAAATLVDKVKETTNITLMPYTTVQSFNGDKHLEDVTLIVNGDKQNLKVDGAFIFIGYTPATNYLKDLDVLNEQGFIEVDNHYQTKVEGLYAVGDCINHPIKQIATAVGDATTATNIIIKEL